MWCRNLLKHALQVITCIQEDPGYGKYHGLETTCSFFGIGKKTVLKTLKDNIDEFADLNKLCLLDSETSIDVSRNFVARLYDQKGKMKSAHDNLNRLRDNYTTFYIHVTINLNGM
jgi:predicted acetyltransferase